MCYRNNNVWNVIMENFKRGMHNFLYVLSVQDRYVKIGICKEEEHLYKRLKTLQTGNPHKISIIFFEERESAKDAEKYLHNCFSDKRKEGEWFEDLTLHDIRVKLMLFHEQV